MYYTITVTYKGVHLFETAKHSLRTKVEFNNAYAILADKFTTAEDYKVVGAYNTEYSEAATPE